MFRFIYKFFLSFVCLVWVSLGADVASLELKFSPNPVSTLFAFPMQTESLEIVIENSSVTGLSLDDPLKVCFFEKKDNLPIAEVALTKKTESSFMSAPNLVGRTTFSISSSKIVQLKGYIDDTLSGKNYAVVCKSTATPQAVDLSTKIDCTFLYSKPRTFTEGLREILKVGVAIDNTVSAGYPEAGAFVSYLIFHSKRQDLERRIKDIFTEQSSGGYGSSYDYSIDTLLQHMVDHWHFGLATSGKINSRVSKWPTFFICDKADISTIKAIVEQVFGTVIVDGPIKGAPGLIQLGFQSKIPGLYYEALPIPKTRVAFMTKNSVNMIHSNYIAVDIAHNVHDCEVKYGKIVCDEIRSAKPIEITFASLRIIMEQVSQDQFIINFSTLFPLKEDKFKNANSIFEAKMQTVFPIQK